MNSQINLKIINARLPDYSSLQEIKLARDGTIVAIEPMQSCQETENFKILDLRGDWLSLGGVDLQINGGLGLAFPDLEFKNLPLLADICQFLWQEGIDAFLPTIVTTSVENIQRSLAVIAEFMKQQEQQGKIETARVLGVHLEGPFLNYEKRGAHPAKYLLPLNLDNIKKVLGDYSAIVKIITLAPELAATEREITYLKDLGITISLGHSLANAERAKQAFNLGASMVTHACNAMPSLHHREPGLLGEAIINKNVYCGLIADGQHVCPTMIRLLLKASDFDRGIFLVSDALAPIGLNDGLYPWDDRQIEVKNGTARLLNGTLAGTTLPLLVGVENLVKWDICDLGAAIAMATESPRKAINAPGIDRGQQARLLRWNWDENRKKITWQRLELGI